MIFLNTIMLAALAAVGIPILIHLLHRGRAKAVDWGAMQFVLASLASRSRRVMLEEIILLSIRGLLMVLIVLAAARPFLPSTSVVPWAVVLPAVLAATGFEVTMGVHPSLFRPAELHDRWKEEAHFIRSLDGCPPEAERPPSFLFMPYFWLLARKA